MPSNRRNRERVPGRRTADVRPRRRLLVVCEGVRSEPDYLRGYERMVCNANVTIEIPRERGEPRKIVEIAKARRQAADIEAQRQGDEWLSFDEVWCVFDRDDHERFQDACQMALANGFMLAVSNPCFELWLLLHFRDSPGARHRKELSRLLRDEYLPGYEKCLDFDDLADGVGTAVDRARRLDQRAEEMGEAGRNPTTGVYRLVESIGRRG